MRGQERLTVFAQTADDPTLPYDLVHDLMVYLSIEQFVFSAETIEPSAIVSVGVGADEQCGLFARIEQQPVRVSKPEQLPLDHIDPGIKRLLPYPDERLDHPSLDRVRQIFEVHGAVSFDTPIVIDATKGVPSVSFAAQ